VDTASYAVAFSLLALLGNAATFALLRSTALRERAATPLAKDANERVEKLEREFPEWRLAMEGMLDRAGDILDAADKKRARAVSTEMRAQAREQQYPQLPLTRGEQLRLVRERFGGK